MEIIFQLFESFVGCFVIVLVMTGGHLLLTEVLELEETLLTMMSRSRSKAVADGVPPLLLKLWPFFVVAVTTSLYYFLPLWISLGLATIGEVASLVILLRAKRRMARD